MDGAAESDSLSGMTDERPDAGEHGEYFGRYVARVPDGDVLATLRRQAGETAALLADFGEARGGFRYAAGKWSVKEVVGHLVDCERVFVYRALTFARGDRGPLPGFEQDDFVRDANFDARTLASLAEELALVRRSSLALFEGLDEDAWLRSGHANDTELSVRAVPWILAGHEHHHVAVLRDRYL